MNIKVYEKLTEEQFQDEISKGEQRFDVASSRFETVGVVFNNCKIFVDSDNDVEKRLVFASQDTMMKFSVNLNLVEEILKYGHGIYILKMNDKNIEDIIITLSSVIVKV